MAATQRNVEPGSIALILKEGAAIQKGTGMLEKLPSPRDDVLAFRIGGHASSDDIRTCYAWLTEALATHPKLHLYIEVVDFSGLGLDALLEDLRQGFPLLGKLSGFGRVAVVSDQRWVRWLSRIESTLLPGVSYRTYKLDERATAIAWVEGREKLPYGNAVSLFDTDHPGTIGIEINGRLSHEELGQIARDLNARRAERKIEAVLVRIRAFDGVDAQIGLDPDYLRMKFGFLRELKRYAVVGGPEWLKAWVKLLAPAIRIDTRYFPLDREAEAWRWLDVTPVGPTGA